MKQDLKSQGIWPTVFTTMPQCLNNQLVDFLVHSNFCYNNTHEFIVWFGSLFMSGTDIHLK